MAVAQTKTVLCALIIIAALTVGGNCCPELRRCFPEIIEQVSCVNSTDPIWTVEASSTDCSVYLFCFNGIGLQTCCPIGMYFNPNTNECDDEANVDCDIEPLPCPEQTTSVPGNEETTTSNGEATTTENLETTTTSVGEETTKEDLETTTNGVETTEDQETTTSESIESTTDDQESPTPGETTTEPTEMTTVNQGPDLDALCAEQSSDSMVELAYPSECHKYVVCNGREFITVETCPAGLHFNPTLLVCDSPDHAECVELVCQNNPDGCMLEMGSLNSCRQYFICIGNTTIVRQCSPGTIFDAESGWCILEDSNNPCEPVRPPPPPPSVIQQCRADQELTKIPHPEECDVYYRCLNGRLLVRQCPPGLLFDINRTQCNLEEYVTCVDN